MCLVVGGLRVLLVACGVGVWLIDLLVRFLVGFVGWWFACFLVCFGFMVLCVLVLRAY